MSSVSSVRSLPATKMPATRLGFAPVGVEPFTAVSASLHFDRNGIQSGDLIRELASRVAFHPHDFRGLLDGLPITILPKLLNMAHQSRSFFD
jgi:hypothetical protein